MTFVDLRIQIWKEQRDICIIYSGYEPNAAENRAKERSVLLVREHLERRFSSAGGHRLDRLVKLLD